MAENTKPEFKETDFKSNSTSYDTLEEKSVYIRHLAPEAEYMLFPVGGRIKWFPEVSGEPDPLPPKFMRCKGQELSRKTSRELFGIIGVRYGDGDGVNTFNLPNDPDYIIHT